MAMTPAADAVPLQHLSPAQRERPALLLGASVVFPTVDYLREGLHLKAPEQLALARYMPNGLLDPSFGQDGKVVFDGGSLDADPLGS